MYYFELILWIAEPFLTSRHGVLHVPLLGELPLSSVLLFDLGVYMLVFGSTVLMLIAIAHQSLRTQQPEPTAARTAPAPRENS